MPSCLNGLCCSRALHLHNSLYYVHLTCAIVSSNLFALSPQIFHLFSSRRFIKQCQKQRIFNLFFFFIFNRNGEIPLNEAKTTARYERHVNKYLYVFIRVEWNDLCCMRDKAIDSNSYQFTIQRAMKREKEKKGIRFCLFAYVLDIVPLLTGFRMWKQTL